MKTIEPLENETELMKAVREDINEDTKDLQYNDVRERLEDIIMHGCVSGTVGSMIYHEDTVKFFETHKEEINKLLYRTLQEYGTSNPADIINGWDSEDYLCLETNNQNRLAWFAYEEMARIISDSLPEKEG